MKKLTSNSLETYEQGGVNAWEYGDNDPSDPEQNWDEDNQS